MDVAESLCQQRPCPVGVASRRLLVEQSQNTRIVLRPIFRLRAALTRVVEPSHAFGGVTNPPFGRCANRAANRSRDLPRRRAVARQQDDPRPKTKAVLAFHRTRQTFEFGALQFRQCDRRRVRNAAHST